MRWIAVAVMWASAGTLGAICVVELGPARDVAAAWCAGLAFGAAAVGTLVVAYYEP